MSDVNPTRIGASTEFDREVWNQILDVAENCGLGIDEIIELWPLFIRRVSFSRFIALYEIYKMVAELPGFIIECGVFRGQSLGLFRQLLEVLNPGDSLKKIIGFDTFEGFTKLNLNDGPLDPSRAKTVGGWHSKGFDTHLETLLEIGKKDSYLPRVERVQLIKGDVSVTIPKFVAENPGIRISLLNLDLDLYEPTKVALEYLYPRIVSGGVIILDEYAMPGFPGESKAFEEYFHGLPPKVVKFGFASTPGGYFVKE